MKKRSVYIILLVILIGGGYIAWMILGPTVSSPDQKYFYIKTGSTYDEVKGTLVEKKIIGGTFFFNLLANKLNYPKAIKPGRYEIKSGMSLLGLVRMLRAGKQVPVNLVIIKLRTKEDLAAKIAANFECDSLSVISFLNNKDSLARYQLDTNTVMTAIIPNSYSIFWNTPANRIFRKLYNDEEKFWTEERRKKASALNMTPKEVYTMASIVEEETNKQEDKGKIASVYINRIETGQRLEADPTVKFSLRDFGLKRIRNKHTQYPSDYNTYLHTGLPPGPICTPSSRTIDAVLNAPQTNYTFFVSKPDFSGYSVFAGTYAEHMINAKAYQHFLDSLERARAER